MEYLQMSFSPDFSDFKRVESAPIPLLDFEKVYRCCGKNESNLVGEHFQTGNSAIDFNPFREYSNGKFMSFWPRTEN
jgi:hypothetical protein